VRGRSKRWRPVSFLTPLAALAADHPVWHGKDNDCESAVARVHMRKLRRSPRRHTARAIARSWLDAASEADPARGNGGITSSGGASG